MVAAQRRGMLTTTERQAGPGGCSKPESSTRVCVALPQFPSPHQRGIVGCHLHKEKTLSISLGFPAQRGTACVPSHVGEAPSPSFSLHPQTPPDPSLVVSSGGAPYLPPHLGQRYPQKAASGATGTQGFSPHGRVQPHPAFTSAGTKSVDLFMYFFKPCLE